MVIWSTTFRTPLVCRAIVSACASAVAVFTVPVNVTTPSLVSTSILWALTVSSAASFDLTDVVIPGSVCAHPNVKIIPAANEQTMNLRVI